MVRQEIYGYLLTHYAISALICKDATAAGIDPDRVKFKRTVRIIRRRVADPAFSPDHRQRILAPDDRRHHHQNNLNTRRECGYPHVVKRAPDNSYHAKKPATTASAMTARPRFSSPIPSSARP